MWPGSSPLHAKCHLDPPSRLATTDGPKIGKGALPPFWGGALPPFWGGKAGSPSNTMSSWPRPTSVPSGILIHTAVWPQETRRKLGVPPRFGDGAGSQYDTVAWAEAYLHSKCHLDPSSRLASRNAAGKKYISHVYSMKYFTF